MPTEQGNNTVESNQNLPPDNSETYHTPPTGNNNKEYHEETMELVDHSDMEKLGGKKLPCTPAIVRLHKTLHQFNVHSPTDSIQSPCSQKLTDAARVRKGHQAHNQVQLQQQRQSKYGQQPQKERHIDFDANDTMECEYEEEKN